MADDLGYADTGPYGSLIRTPAIDRLAAEGILFTQFHTAPMCAPTRAMLLTGNNNHVAGMGEQGPSAELARVPGYEGHLSDRVVPFPRLLRDAGYHTYTVGKWHLGDAREHSPPAAGFEGSWQLTHGAANHFDATGFFEGGSLYRLDGEEAEYPEGAYSTEHFTDRLIEFVDSKLDDGQPFFAFAAYTSPHWPLQVPEIVFMSDNGAAGSEDFYNVGPFVEYLRAHYDNSYENMGRPDSWVSYGPPWAEAGSAPFSRYKTYTREGGIAAQMIIAGPGIARRGQISHAYTIVMDLAPTFLDLAAASYPRTVPPSPW